MRNFNITHFLVEGDALNIFQRINSREKNWSLVGNIIYNIRSMLTKFDFVKVSYVRRSNNAPAHIMSKLALSLEESNA